MVELRVAAKGKPSGNASDLPDFSHLSAADEDFALLERRRPDSTKSKGSGFFSKLKAAMSKRASDGEQGTSRLSFSRRSLPMQKASAEQEKSAKEKEPPL